MLYKFYNKIEEVRSFAISDTQIYLSSQNKLCDISGKGRIVSNIPLQGIKFENPYFFITDIEGNSYLIYNEVVYLNNIFIKKVINKNCLLISRNGFTELFDIKMNEFKSFLDFKIFKFLVVGDIIVFYKNKIINCYSLTSTTPIWKYDLSSLDLWKDSTGEDQSYELKEFIGVIDISLFIKLNANEILVLDINTGQFSDRLQFIDYFEGETCIERPSPEIPFFQTRYVINQDKSIIQGLFLDLYYEVSFINGKIYTKVFGLKKEYEKWGINPRNISKENVLFNDKLYFLAYEQGRFGILNTITKEIDYVSEPIAIGDRSNNFTQLKEIQVSNDKVYVLASDRTLHVFEKSNQ